MHKVARIKREGDDRFVVHHPDKGVLRYGHDVRADGKGLGNRIVWKDAAIARDYAELLNRTKRF